MAARQMGPELLEMVAERFRALGDRARLSLLQQLRGGACTVNELVEATGLGQANVSRHLATLFANGLVTREREGVYVRYALADRDVLKLCELVCGRIENDLAERRRVVSGR
ncbi:MAG: metalloregulator ArsR/SmtB family transcription factor [Gemmatimonadetes bacterium]|nr:metalloregulator ArsR/SmtB family transcription factor [Gemmatimonadota bacterium]